MMRSLYSGISGLRNHQTRMDVIGNNIANVNTAGYKTSRVIFQDIFSQNVSSGMANQGNIGGTNPMQIGLGIRLSNVDVIHSRAAFGRTDRETDMMINGDGFFVVMQTNPDTGEDEYLYTRAGNFVIDSEGYLVNSAGYYVMGYAVEPMMGVVDAGQEEREAIPRVQVQLSSLREDPDDPTSDSLWVVGGTIPAGYFSTMFPELVGGVDDDGDPIPWPSADVSLDPDPDSPHLIRIPAGALGPDSPAITMNLRTLGLLDEDGVAIPDAALPAMTRTIQEGVPRQPFRAPIFGLVQSGTPDSAAALDRIRVVSESFQSIRYDLLSFPQQDILTVRSNPLLTEDDGGLVGILRRAQEAEDWAAVQVAQQNINDFISSIEGDFPPEAVSLPGFSVANNGDVSVIIANKAVVIGRVAVAMFANPEGLEKAGNSLYRETASSGPVVVTEAYNEGAGQIDAGGLEMSNVDLANEFTDMIVTQRGFQANSRIITVSDSLLEELVNLKR